MGMTHHERDGVAAVARARASYRGRPGIRSSPRSRSSPGTWWMVTQFGDRYAIILLLEIGGERGYRAVTGDDEPASAAADRVLPHAARRERAGAQVDGWRTQARPGGVKRRDEGAPAEIRTQTEAIFKSPASADWATGA